MKTLAIMVIAVLLAGCGGGWMPEQKPVSREYPFGKDQAWRGLMDYFTRHSIQIKTIEKDSGVIYAERLYGKGEEFSEFADCGQALVSRLPGADQLGLMPSLSDRKTALRKSRSTPISRCL